MTASVTIILPVFNSEKTLPETLDSIRFEIQNSPEIEWLVIAVDDGSTDDSTTVLEQWKSRLPLRFEKIKHTGSPARPRNLGIDLAESKYVFFLDADDKLIPGGLTKAIELAEECESDVVLPRLVSLDGRGVPRGMFSRTKREVSISNSRIYWALNPMKLIRRSLLDDQNIRFDAALRRDEDQPFAFKAYLAAKKISILADPPVVGVRYSPSGNNLTLRDYAPSDLFQYLNTMSEIMDSANLSEEIKRFLLIRNWEIEISREFIWKRLAVLDESLWRASLEKLNEFSRSHLVPNMLPRTSIRWRGITGLIGSEKYLQLESLLKARRQYLTSKNPALKALGACRANWIRLLATVRLPKKF
ncbi:MAG: glycosyltransferase family 2 protein [Actinobacteria bacterium]|nr:glycosyltransferase family 2 protein [Actinomycetota bacterium]